MSCHEFISSLQKEYEKNKLNIDGSAYRDMLEKEYIKALKGKFDLDKIYTTKDGRYKVSTPIQICKTKKIDVLKELYQYFFGAEVSPTIEYLFQQWLAEFEKLVKSGHRSWDTLDKYKSDWKRFYKDTELVKKPISDVKMSDLKKHYQEITANEAITRKTLSNAKSLLNVVFDYAVDHDIITINLARSANTKDLICKISDNEGKVYSTEERTAVLEAIDQLPKFENSYGRAITVMFCLCARIGEIKALKWSDIDFKNRAIRIHSSMRRTRDENGKQTYQWTNTTKGRQKSGQRIEPMSDRAYRALKRQRQEDPFSEYVFMDNGHALDTTQFNRWLKRACEAAGVVYLSSHKIRFMAVTEMLDHGVSLGKAQKAAGHARPSTTESYNRNKKTAVVGLDTWNNIFN